MTRRIRLISGLILLAFVATHLLNHALGLVSLAALEAGRAWFLLLWRNPLGSSLFYLALLAHMLLAFWAIFQRRTFNLRPVDWVQLLLGLWIPVLLAAHALNTRLAYEVFGQEDSYPYELTLFFHLSPNLIYKQMLLLIVVWLHGAIGVHQWLRLKPGYRRVQWLAFAVALLLPAAALAGTWVAGRDVLVLAADPVWLEQLLARTNPMDDAELAFLGRLEAWFLGACGLMLLGVLLLRPARRFLRRRLGLVQITYPGGSRVTVAKGTTVLEASRQHKIPHASVCGGRGRCSTCRVRVGQGLETLPAAAAEETRVLKRIAAPDNVRLACQVRPSQDCGVVPLLAPSASLRAVGPEPDYSHGQEREIVVLFADLRGFTALSEQKLPYDVVFLLNRYFAAMGPAIVGAGGYVDKFIGDGVMALFGLESGPKDASRAALKAARNMAGELVKLNQALDQELPTPLRLGIGLHLGPAIVGKMGYGETSSLTAVGDTVNTASRLEAATKDFAVQLVVSQSVAEAAGVPGEHFETRELEVRGRQERMVVTLVPNAAALAGQAWLK
ncbi:MAG: adenylate/guanylate cyclase domain-containing protein [Pseudomonadota bacterium]